jgi:hypothetical protein
MLSIEQLKDLKIRNFSFVNGQDIDNAIAQLEKKQLELGIPGAQLAQQRAQIIADENNAPALAIEQAILADAHNVLLAEINAQDAAIITQSMYREETDTVSDPE